jgi:hypothetical protein
MRFKVPLLEQGQLLSQEQILGGHDPRGPHRHDREPQHVRQELTNNVDQRNHALIMP